ITWDVKDDFPPALWGVKVKLEDLELLEALKIFSYKTQVLSPRLKMAELRGKEIVAYLFESLCNHPELLPDDVSSVYRKVDKGLRKRVICDFIAGMTDRYAVEFYGRLRSDNPQTIFKPF